MIEETLNGKATIDYDGLGMIIKIPSKKNWFLIVFIIAWLGGWYMGEMSAMEQISNLDNLAENGFILFWLLGWSLGGCFMLVVLIWSLLGSEIITIDSQILQLEKRILNIGIYSKEYEMKSLKKLELNPGQTMKDLFGQKKVTEFWGMTGGKIRFDYGMKTIRFAVGIDEAEARFLIHEIEKKGYYKHVE